MTKDPSSVLHCNSGEVENLEVGAVPMVRANQSPGATLSRRALVLERQSYTTLNGCLVSTTLLAQPRRSFADRRASSIEPAHVREWPMIALGTLGQLDRFFAFPRPVRLRAITPRYHPEPATNMTPLRTLIPGGLQAGYPFLFSRLQKSARFNDCLPTENHREEHLMSDSRMSRRRVHNVTLQDQREVG